MASDARAEDGAVRPVGDIEVEGAGGAEEAEKVDEMEPEAGARKPEKMVDPKLPNKTEVEEHQKTHLPFRNWCKHCVKGRGVEEPHKRQKEEVGMPEIHVDFMFMGDEGKDKKLTILVAKERSTKMTMATVLPSKSSGPFAARRTVAFMREIGCEFGDLTMKSDNEEAIKALVSDVARVRAAGGGPGRTNIETSKTYSSASNGVVERGIRSVQGMVRVLRSALEDRVGAKVDGERAIWPWLVEYAAFLLNRGEVGHDGKTAYERCKAKRGKMPGLELGEKVLWRRKPVGNQLAKLTSLWEDGVFLGVKGSSGEFIIGDKLGVWKSRTMMRRPVEERWNAENLELVGGVPWRTSEEDKNADGEALRMEVPEAVRMAPEEEKEEEELVVPRNVYLKKSDFETHGYSKDCKGCRAVLRGAARTPHSAECRKRMMEAMAGDGRIKRAEDRINEFLSKTLEKEDKKRKEKEESQKKRRVDEGEGAREVDVEDKEMGSQPQAEEMASRARAEQNQPGEMASRAQAEQNRDAGSSRGSDNKRPVWADMEDDEEDVREHKRRMVDLVWLAGAVNQEEAEEVPDAVWTEEKGEEVLDPEKLKLGIKDEMDFMEKIGVFEDSTEQECWDRTGAAPTSTRWVSVKKILDSGEEIVRSRLVGRDFKDGSGTNEDLFAATPPLEALKLLLRASVVQGEGEEETKLMFVDVRKAHLIPQCDEEVFVRLPEEFGNKVVRLRRWLYGMRKAANRWEEHYTKKLREAGFLQGVASPVVFYNPVTGVRCVVHGDDFTFSGKHQDLVAIRKWMESWCEIKFRGIMGTGSEDVKEREILGRILRRTAGGLELEADEKHRRILMERCGLEEESNHAEAPMAEAEGGAPEPAKPDQGERDDDGGGELAPWEASWYRAMVARANYLAQDRMDVQYTTKELSRRMSKPRVEDVGRLKRLVRYLVGAEKVVQVYPRLKSMPNWVDAFGDSDWAACKTTRRSTSGGVVLFGGAALKTYSSTQGSIATSVGEAEYYAALKGAAEGLGVQALARDLGLEVEVRLWSDSTSARGIACRRGLSGRTRHMETKFLWLQEAVARKRLHWGKVHTAVNPADLLTKVKSRAEAGRLIELAGGRLAVRQANRCRQAEGGVSEE